MSDIGHSGSLNDAVVGDALSACKSVAPRSGHDRHDAILVSRRPILPVCQSLSSAQLRSACRSDHHVQEKFGTRLTPDKRQAMTEAASKAGREIQNSSRSEMKPSIRGNEAAQITGARLTPEMEAEWRIVL